MSFPCLIHFFGPDGAGKSTQAKILTDFLEKKGVRVKKIWVRSPHTVAFVLWRIFIKIGLYRVVLNQFGVQTKLPAVDRDKGRRSFWAAAEFLGLLPVILRARILILRGYRLVAERFILDSIVTVAYFVNDINFLRGSISRLLLRFIPINTVFIFLDVDYATVYRRRTLLFSAEKRRRKGRGTCDSVLRSSVEPKSFIDFQSAAYKVLAKSFGALEIDTSKSSIEETSNTILKYLKLR